MANLEVSWFNYRTQEYEEGPVKDYRDFIPQSVAAQGLYQCYLDMGKEPIDAAILVLKAVVGKGGHNG